MKKLFFLLALSLSLAFAGVTIDIADINRSFVASWIDTAGVEHTGFPAGYSAAWTTDDGGKLVSISPNTVGGTPNCQVHLIGMPGSFNLTVTFSKVGMPDITGTTAVTITGIV